MLASECLPLGQINAIRHFPQNCPGILRATSPPMCLAPGSAGSLAPALWRASRLCLPHICPPELCTVPAFNSWLLMNDFLPFPADSYLGASQVSHSSLVTNNRQCHLNSRNMMLNCFSLTERKCSLKTGAKCCRAQLRWQSQGLLNMPHGTTKDCRRHSSCTFLTMEVTLMTTAPSAGA